MVTHLNIALDDETAERVRAVKEDRGLTWAEFLVEAAESVESSDPATRTQPTRTTSTTEPVTVGRESALGAVEGLDLPGSGETLEQRQAAVQRLYDHLRDNGTARRRDFAELVDGDEVSYTSFESFWTNCVKAREALGSLPGVVAPGEGEHTWRFDESRIE